LIWIKGLRKLPEKRIETRFRHQSQSHRKRRSVTKRVLDVARYSYNISHAGGGPLGSFLRHEEFKRALKNIKKFYFGVFVQWDHNTRRHCAANEANRVSDFFG